MKSAEINEFKKRIGRAIKKLRWEERIKADDLAKVLDVTQPTISRIENGTASIPAEKLCFLAKSFDRPLSFFVGERSSVTYDEEDILRAGLAFYGAKNLKVKRTIDINQYYRTYADFLNGALNYVDDSRFAGALAVTIYWQAGNANLKFIKMLSSLQHKKLIDNLYGLVCIILSVLDSIDRPKFEKRAVERYLSKFIDEYEDEYDLLVNKGLFAFKPEFIAKSINENLNK